MAHGNHDILILRSGDADKYTQSAQA
jgi:hypothetical protein